MRPCYLVFTMYSYVYQVYRSIIITFDRGSFYICTFQRNKMYKLPTTNSTKNSIKCPYSYQKLLRPCLPPRAPAARRLSANAARTPLLRFSLAQYKVSLFLLQALARRASNAKRLARFFAQCHRRRRNRGPKHAPSVAAAHVLLRRDPLLWCTCITR